MPTHPLKRERELRGWSQARLAEMLDVTPRTVIRWELGQAFPYPHYREQLCALFGKSAYDLGLLPENEVPTTGSSAEKANETRSGVEENPFPALYDPMGPEARGSARHLFGREDLLTLLKQRLGARESQRLTALSGLPGVGKTALVAALVTDRQVQESFRDGILWAGVGPQPDVLNLLVRWATLLGAQPPAGKRALQVEEWSQVIRTVIGKRRMLLVLDDVWKVEATLLMQVGGPNCAYLLTTRLPQVAFAFAEQGAVTVPELAEEDGVALLGRAVPHLVAQEPEQVRALVGAVGGLPLALKLLANVLAAQVFTGQPRRVQAALARLQEAEQRLRIRMAVAPGEHPLALAQETTLSLQATIEISERRLSEPARQALRALAIFPARPNSFSEDAALAVGQMSLEVLDELWDAGLLESNGPGRYQLHQTIVDYERIQGQLPEIAQRLVVYMGHYLQKHAQDHEALELELSNLLVALDVAVEVGLQRELIEDMDALFPFLRTRARYLLANRYLQRAYEAALSQADLAGQMRMLQHLAFFAERRGEFQEAERYAMSGLELAQQLGQLEAQSALLTTLGRVAFDHGDYTQAITFHEEGLALARRVGAVKHICTLLNLLVAIANVQGRYAQALEMTQEGLELARQQKDNEGIANSLSSLAQVTIAQGDYDQAESYLLEAFELTHQLNYREKQAQVLNNLASIAWNRGNTRQAETYYLEGLKLARQIGNPNGICMLLSNLADLLITRRDYAEAEGYLQEGLELARQQDYRVFLPCLLGNLGALYAYRGEYERANACLEDAVRLARQEKSAWLLSNALGMWGNIHLQFQNLDAATSMYQEMFTLNVDPQLVALALYGLARVAAQRGEMSRAQQLGQESLAAFEALKHGSADEVRQWLQHLDETEGESPSADL